MITEKQAYKLLEKKAKNVTVGDLKMLLTLFKEVDKVTDDTEVWLSRDEEGNGYSPLMRFNDGTFNVEVEDDKSKITLYPTH